MQFRFNKISFGLANLPALVLLGFALWLIFITIKVPIDFHSDVVSIGLELTCRLLPTLFFFFLIPSYILARQYFMHSSHMIVDMKDDYIEISRTNTKQKHIIKKSDIQKIVSVEPTIKNHRLFSEFSYLVVFDKENTTILPCFVVTKDDFFNLFGKYDNLIESYPYTPYIKPKNYVGIKKIPDFGLSKLSDIPIKISGQSFELLRILVICGLAFYTFTAFSFGQTWFIVSLAITLIVSLLLLLHKRVFITNNKLIIRHFRRENSYSYKEINSLTEIQWTRILTLNLSDPMIKLQIIDFNGISKNIFFFPRKKTFEELKNKLQPR